jgi:hypothetical protein
MLTRQEKGKNHYQGIFAELHRRFGVPSYKGTREHFVTRGKVAVFTTS